MEVAQRVVLGGPEGMVPKQISETRRPVGPSVLYFVGTFAGLKLCSGCLDVGTRLTIRWKRTG